MAVVFYSVISFAIASIRAVAFVLSCGLNNALTSATPSVPLCFNCIMLSLFMPPMATTGSGQTVHISASPSTPRKLASVFVALAFLTMFFVKHGNAKIAAKKGLEALDIED